MSPVFDRYESGIKRVFSKQKKTDNKLLSKKFNSNTLVTPWYHNNIKYEKMLSIKVSADCFLGNFKQDIN